MWRHFGSLLNRVIGGRAVHSGSIAFHAKSPSLSGCFLLCPLHFPNILTAIPSARGLYACQFATSDAVRTQSRHSHAVCNAAVGICRARFAGLALPGSLCRARFQGGRARPDSNVRDGECGSRRKLPSHCGWHCDNAAPVSIELIEWPMEEQNPVGEKGKDESGGGVAAGRHI